MQEVTINKNIRKIAENVLPKHLNKVVNFACVNYEDWAVRFSLRACINEQKITNQSVREDQIKDSIKRQTRND